MSVEVRGFVGDVPDLPALLALVADVSRAHGAAVQVMRGDRVWSRTHLERAAALARRATAEGRNRSPDLATEVALYAAGERQVTRALETLGVRPGRALPLAAIALGDAAAAALDALEARAGWRRDDGVVERPKDEDALEALGVDAALRASVPRERWEDLVLERVALVDLLKA